MLSINEILDLIQSGKMNESNLSGSDLLRIQFYRDKINEVKQPVLSVEEINDFIQKYNKNNYLYDKVDFKLSKGKVTFKKYIRFSETPNFNFDVSCLKQIRIDNSDLMTQLNLKSNTSVELENLSNLKTIELNSNNTETLHIFDKIDKIESIVENGEIVRMIIKNTDINKLQHLLVNGSLQLINCNGKIEIDCEKSKIKNITISGSELDFKIKNCNNHIKLEKCNMVDLTVIDSTCSAKSLTLDMCDEITNLKGFSKYDELYLDNCKKLSTLKGISTDTKILSLWSLDKLENLKFVGENTFIQIYNLQNLKSLKNIINSKHDVLNITEIFKELYNKNPNLSWETIEEIYTEKVYNHFVNPENKNRKIYAWSDYLLLLTAGIFNNFDKDENLIKQIYLKLMNNESLNETFKKAIKPYLVERFPFLE